MVGRVKTGERMWSEGKQSKHEQKKKSAKRKVNGLLKGIGEGVVRAGSWPRHRHRHYGRV